LHLLDLFNKLNEKTYQNFSLLIRYIPALAFLSHLEISNTFHEVKVLLSPDAEPIIRWFENNCAHERAKTTLRNSSVQ
jgi:hypothetical protein